MTAVILQITAKAIPPKSHHNSVMGSERSIGHWWVIYIFEDVNNMRLEEMEKLESVWIVFIYLYDFWRLRRILFQDRPGTGESDQKLNKCKVI